MPAKLTIPRRITIVNPTTYLPFTSTSNGYINTDMQLNGAGAVIIGRSKLYYIGLSVTIDKEGQYVANTAQIKVYRNNNTILEFTQSYDEKRETTFFTAAYFNLVAGDVITASINFDQPTREIIPKKSELNEEDEQKLIEDLEKGYYNDPTRVAVLANPNSTFLNIV